MPSIVTPLRDISQGPTLCAPAPVTAPSIQGIVDMAKCSDVSSRVQSFLQEQFTPADCFAAQIVPPPQSTSIFPPPPQQAIWQYIPPGSMLEYDLSFTYSDSDPQMGEAQFFLIHDGQALSYHPWAARPTGWGDVTPIGDRGPYVFVLLTQGSAWNWSFRINGPRDTSSVPPCWPLLVNYVRFTPGSSSPTPQRNDATVWYFDNTAPPNAA